MDANIQPDTHQIRAVSVRANPHNPDLISLLIDEGGSSTNLCLKVEVWQRVTDELAAAGVVPGGHRTTILTWPTSEATS